MIYSLNSHNQRYNFSSFDKALSLATGFSGLPLALRHRQLAQSSHLFTTSLTHNTIAAIECVPILGGIVALIEFLVVKYFFKPIPHLPKGEGFIHGYYSNPDDFTLKRPIKSLVSDPEKAAISIQVFWKTYRKNRKQYFLPSSVRNRVKEFLSNRKASAPRAADGCTPVFFPKALPDIVLKVCRNDSYFRLCVINRVRDICSRDHYDSLEIPKVLLYRDKRSDRLLIEQRLPLKPAMFDQLTLYMTHLEQFTPAIRDFTHLALKIKLSDLDGEPRFTDLKTPRYDNFPLFINEKGEFKIGLIDLEHCSVEESIYPEVLKELIYIFPHHFEVILEEAKKLGVPEDYLDSEILNENNRLGKQFIQTCYTDLLVFAASKQNTPFITEKQKAEIVDEIMIEQKYRTGKSALKRCLNEICKIIDSDERKKMNGPLAQYTVGFSQLALNSYDWIPYKASLDDRYKDNSRLNIRILLQKMVEKKILHSFAVT